MIIAIITLILKNGNDHNYSRYDDDNAINMSNGIIIEDNGDNDYSDFSFLFFLR